MKRHMNNRWVNTALALLLIVGVSVFTWLNPTDAIIVQIEQDKLCVEISDEFQYAVPIDAIQKIVLEEEPVYGGDGQKIAYGQYVNNVWGEYSQCVYTQVPVCIVVYAQDGTYVFNLEHEENTRSFYEAMLEYCSEQN